MLKRKKQKQTKKAQQRKQAASRMPQQPHSEKDLEKILIRVPLLAYEEEFNDLRFEAETLRSYQDSEEAEPDILQKLISPEFIADCKERLAKMEERTKGDMKKNMMVKGATFMLDETQISLALNPLIVAIYLRSKADLAGEVLAMSQVINAFELYEADNLEYITNQLEANTANQQNPEGFFADEAIIEGEWVEEDASSDVITGTVEKPPLDQGLMTTYYQTLPELGEEAEDRIKDDLEEFLENYVTRAMAEWNAAMVDDFLGNWFIKNLNPVIDDLVSMQNSLEHFFQFLSQQAVLAPDEIQKIMRLLQDKEKYKQRMTS